MRRPAAILKLVDLLLRDEEGEEPDLPEAADGAQDATATLVVEGARRIRGRCQ